MCFWGCRYCIFPPFKCSMTLRTVQSSLSLYKAPLKALCCLGHTAFHKHSILNSSWGPGHLEHYPSFYLCIVVASHGISCHCLLLTMKWGNRIQVAKDKVSFGCFTDKGAPSLQVFGNVGHEAEPWHTTVSWGWKGLWDFGTPSRVVMVISWRRCREGAWNTVLF